MREQASKQTENPGNTVHGRVWGVDPGDRVFGGCTGCHCPPSWERIPPIITSLGKIKPKQEVWFLQNAYCYHIIIKTKNQNSNYHKSGPLYFLKGGGGGVRSKLAFRTSPPHPYLHFSKGWLTFQKHMKFLFSVIWLQHSSSVLERDFKLPHTISLSGKHKEAVHRIKLHPSRQKVTCPPGHE